MREYIVEGYYGPCFDVRTEWREEYGEFMLANGITELSINSAHDFEGKSLEFLKTLPFLTGLEALAFAVSDASPIQHLQNLRYLLMDRTGDKGIDFNCFPRLEWLGYDWLPKSESVFQCTSLTEAYISGYPGKTVEPFRNLKSLKRLELSNGPTRDVTGLQSLISLRKLGLYYLRKLESIDGIEHLTNLETLNVETCRKVESIAPVSGLIKLREFAFANCGSIASIEPLRNLKELETVHLWGSTTILDGDFSALTELPRLKDVRFRNRKHYSLRSEQFSPFGENPDYPKARLE